MREYEQPLQGVGCGPSPGPVCSLWLALHHSLYGKGSTGGTEVNRGVASLAAASHGLLTSGTQAGEADTWLTQQGGGLV